MKKGGHDLDLDLDDREAYVMCYRKKRFKSSKAGRIAGKIKQRKYQCPICGHWHLTKKGIK